MNTRLQQFLSAENLSQSQFADSINVARASISHIMAGRNKPGFDFIENLARRYPTLNIEWFITGKGRMYKSSPEAVSAPVQTVEPIEGDLFGETMSQPISNTLDKPAQTSKQKKDISKILVFYDDGTFEEYTNVR